MTKKCKVLVILSIIIFIQKNGSAQFQQEHKYLVQAGQTDSLYSNILGAYRTLYVQLPENYAPGGSPYPVAFLLDGEVFLPTLIDVQNYYSGGFTPEMVLVGISNASNRTRDLTPSKMTQRYGMPYKEENGEAENFARFLGEELIPYIEEKYPVTSYRTLIGHSYGGLFTLYTLLNKPELFANYLAIDPSLDWDNQKLLREAQDILSLNRFEGKSIFLSLSGQLHMQNSEITIENVMSDTTDYTLFARSNIAFSQVVQQHLDNGLSFEWKFYPNDLHGTVPFPSIMDGLISLFHWYQMENTDKINAFDTSKEELRTIIKKREKKLLDHFGYPVPPYPEELLNMSGYMNMDMQQPDKAKMYFELALEYYPASPNAYDSMADYYEAQEDSANAILFLKKAYALNSNPYYLNRIRSLENK